MENKFLKELEHEVADLRNKLVNHPVYSHIKTVEDLTIFMESHVYAVWDFMSLLKALQINLTCVQIPWRPVGNASTRYLINEIVTGEESDVDQYGNRLSHFELYLNAMHQAGANTALVSSLIDDITNNKPIEEVLNNHSFSPAAMQFMEFTFKTIATEQPHLMATVFTFGREDLIPDMFISFIKELKKQFPDKVDIFQYYIERHIEVDGGHHAELAHQMTLELCGTDPSKWLQATEFVKKALQVRIALWDEILQKIS
ncbi:MAG: heme oxygenase [Chitinophagaceae bacterium]|nr:MAG: heme oxygenase [Chitinophagaceae bacterium]